MTMRANEERIRSGEDAANKDFCVFSPTILPIWDRRVRRFIYLFIFFV